ncbi:response regulator [Ornithinibacillus salinisoli]|uniref:Response regulator n=1 Tax=Ornithinibacillus salinisoli TaxID=1848459 RepID=A0ABW4VY93_9BACI
MIKVLLVEEQRLFRNGVQALIDQESDMEVVGMAKDGDEGIKLVTKLNPDVVLMDIHLPDLDGIRAATHMKSMNDDVKVVFLTSYTEKDLIIRGVSIAEGFLLKELHPKELYRAIRDAYQGQNVLSGEVAAILVDSIRELTMNTKQVLAIRLENRGIRLTSRELEIAKLFMEGKTNKQIARHIHLSEGTIKNYISDLYMKLNINNRQKAIMYLNNLVDM